VPRAQLRGKVGTYDIERSSVGYLLATQDAQRGSIAGALLGALGDNDVVREERTGVLLDKVASGQLSLVYNVLGPTRRHVSMPARRWPSSSPRTTRWWCCAPR
jgi:hypothetical protein